MRTVKTTAVRIDATSIKIPFFVTLDNIWIILNKETRQRFYARSKF